MHADLFYIIQDVLYLSDVNLWRARKHNIQPPVLNTHRVTWWAMNNVHTISLCCIDLILSVSWENIKRKKNVLLLIFVFSVVRCCCHGYNRYHNYISCKCSRWSCETCLGVAAICSWGGSTGTRANSDWGQGSNGWNSAGRTSMDKLVKENKWQKFTGWLSAC